MSLWGRVSGGFDVSDLGWIATREPVPPNIEQVDEHLQAVAENVHFSCRVMSPANRHFRDFETVTAGQEQDLRIKSKSFDLLLLENDAAWLREECLEAA